MSFLQPYWFLLLILIPFILLGGLLVQRNRNKAWQIMVAPRLRGSLVKKSSDTRRWISLSLGMLAMVLIIISIARPYRGKIATIEKISARNILIAIDTSRSMLVRDGAPDRMATAKAVALELLENFPNDRVGVMAFAGSPSIISPLTIDHTAVHETISQLNTDVIPTGGSDMSLAVDLALKTFKKAERKSNALILISDGEDHSEKTNLSAKAIKKSGITVCGIGVGTKKGGIIPDYRYRDKKYRDRKGNTVFSQMRPSALKTLARAGGGDYFPVSSGITRSIKATLSSLERNEQEGKKQMIPNECYQWFILPAIICLALSMLIGSQLFNQSVKTATLILASLFLISTDSDAGAIAQAQQAYEKKDYKAAINLYSQALEEGKKERISAIYFAMGASAYRLDQFETSTSYFSKALLTKDPNLQQNTHYNLGKSLFRTGLKILHPDFTHELNGLKILKFFNQQISSSDQKKRVVLEEKSKKIITLWQDSIEHYEACLKFNPKNTRAIANLNNVKKLLDLLKKTKEKFQKSEKSKQDQEKKSDSQHKPDNQKKSNSDKNKSKNTDLKNKKDESRKSKKSTSPDDQLRNQKESKQKKGESEKAYAARILKENSDAETRPVQQRLLRLRQPEKDW